LSSLALHAMDATILVAICGLIQCSAVCVVVRYVRHRWRIIDVCQHGGRAVVTTLMPHNLRTRWRHAARVRFAGTGEPFLDDEKACFRVRVLDSFRLEVLTSKEDAIVRPLDSAMGTLTLSLGSEMVCMGSLVPTLLAAVLLLPVPFLTVFAISLQGIVDLDEHRFDCVVIVHLVASGIGLVSALSVRFAQTLKPTPLECKLQRVLGCLLGQHPDHISQGCSADRAVSAQQVLDLAHFFRDFVGQRSAYFVVANIVKPLTQVHRLSYAELAGPSPVQYYASHFWGTSFAGLSEAIKSHAQEVAGEEWFRITYWIDFLSMNHWLIGEAGASDLHDSACYTALWSSSCHGTCMILDEEALPLTRSWCLLDALQTHRRHQASPTFALVLCTPEGVIGVPGRSSDEKISLALEARLATLNIANVQATERHDQERIRALLEAGDGIATIASFIRRSMCYVTGLTPTQLDECVGDVADDVVDAVEDSNGQSEELAAPKGSCAAPGLCTQRSKWRGQSMTDCRAGQADNDSFPRLLGSPVSAMV